MRISEERKTLLMELILGPVLFVLGILSLLTHFYPSKTPEPLTPLESKIAGICLTTGGGIFSAVMLYSWWKKRRQ